MSKTIVDLSPLRPAHLLERGLKIFQRSMRRLRCKSAQRPLHQCIPILMCRVPLVVCTSTSGSDVSSILRVTLTKSPYNVGRSSHHNCPNNKCYDHEPVEECPNFNSSTQIALCSLLRKGSRKI